jgi:hypothetical protein
LIIYLMALILLVIPRGPFIIPQLEPARHLYKELWGKGLDSITEKVPDCQETYVSCSHVTSLRLHDLGFNEEALLVRNEYVTSLKTLVDMSTRSEGVTRVVVTGQRGAGTSFSLFVITLLRPHKYYHLRKVLFSVLHPLVPLVQWTAHSVTNIQLNHHL